MRLLVDAANVVGSRPDGWWRDRAGAAARLVGSLAPLVVDGTSVVVVLEGAARAGVPAGRGEGAGSTGAAGGAGSAGAVEVVHAAGSGDDALADLCAPGTLLVTADRELAARARARGADVAGPRWLLAQL